MRFVKRQSWFSRIADSFVGIIIGILFTIVSLPLLFWNEGRAVKTARGLAEGSQRVRQVAADSVNPAHQSQLIHVQGPTFCERDLADEEFGVRVNAIRLQRVVEVLQWDERKGSQRRRRVGGALESVEKSSYYPVRTSSLIDSSRLKQHCGP